MGGDGRDALPGQKYRELGGEEGMLGGSQDTAHDCGSLGTGRDNPSALKGRPAVFCLGGKVTVNRRNTFVYICVHAHKWTLYVHSSTCLCVCRPEVDFRYWHSRIINLGYLRQGFSLVPVSY